MPDFLVNVPYLEGSFSMSLVDLSGEIGRASVSGEFVGEATSGQLDALRDAVGDASNAALIATNLNAQASISLGNATPFDEAHSSVRTKAVFTFQNNSRDIKRLEIPAPDMTMFGSDGKTIDSISPRAAAIIVAALAVLNAGDPAGTYAYIRGGLSSRTRKSTLRNDAPTAAEPTVLQNPPPGPA